MPRSPFTGRNRVSMLLLWLWLPISVAAWLLNSAGAIGVGWTLGIMVGSWATTPVIYLWLRRAAASKENGHA